MTISLGSMETHRTVTQKHRKSRARRVLFRELSKLSKLSKTIKQTSQIKGLLLDTWRLQVSKIGGQVSKPRKRAAEAPACQHRLGA